MNDPAEPGVPFAGLALAVVVDDEAWLGEGLGDLEALTRRACVAALRGAGVPGTVETELGVTFTSDAAVQVLNAQWRGKDQPTNVLSFPLEELAPGETPGPMLGDLVLARETLVAEAASEGKSMGDHLAHLIVHGVLHCLGFDHVEPDEADAMEALEIAILADLSIDNPYAALALLVNPALKPPAASHPMILPKRLAR